MVLVTVGLTWHPNNLKLINFINVYNCMSVRGKQLKMTETTVHIRYCCDHFHMSLEIY